MLLSLKRHIVVGAFVVQAAGATRSLQFSRSLRPCRIGSIKHSAKVTGDVTRVICSAARIWKNQQRILLQIINGRRRVQQDRTHAPQGILDFHRIARCWSDSCRFRVIQSCASSPHMGDATLPAKSSRRGRFSAGRAASLRDQPKLFIRWQCVRLARQHGPRRRRRQVKPRCVFQAHAVGPRRATKSHRMHPRGQIRLY